MGLKRHILSLTAAGGLAVAALAVAVPTHVFAGSTIWCWDNDGNDTPILTGQGGLWVALETGYQAGYPGHVGLCASQTAPGDTTPETVGGAVSANVLAPYNGPYVFDAGCWQDSNSAVQVDCGTVANPTYTFTPAPAGSQGGTYTVYVPFTICFGTNLTGGCSTSATTGPLNTGANGVVVAQVTSGPPPGTDQGAGLALTQGTIWLAGVPIPFAPSDSAAAGVGTHSIEAHPNYAPICVLNSYCQNLPGGAGAAFTGTQDVYSISFNGTNESYNPGYSCIVDYPATGNTC